jgi:hypothetical protein
LIVARRVRAKVGFVLAATLASMLAGSAAYAQNPTPYWSFEVGNWAGSGYRTPDGAFSHCAILGRYRSGISMAIVMDATYDIQLAVGNPEWRLDIGDLYEVGLSVDQRELGRFLASPANRSVLFIQVGPRQDVLDRLRRGYLLEIAAARETFSFALTDTYVALGKLKQCVDTAHLWSSPVTNPFDDGAGGEEPRSPDAGEVEEFRVTIAGLLEAAGLPEARFVDPAGTDHAAATLAWQADGIEGALFFLMMDAQQVLEFTRDLIGNIARECGGTFASQTGDQGRVGDAQLSEFSLACETNGETEFVAAAILASESGAFVFVHYAAGDGLRLRELNENLIQVLKVVSSH